MTETYVSLDIETTGLNPESDEIIEIGAVKFEGQHVLDTFHTMVKPYRSLPYRIQVLTGITQPDLDAAPPLAVVAGELISFVGSHPIIGHNIPFDLGFLSSKGIRLSNTAYDTHELANFFLPRLSDHSLSSIAGYLEVPVVQQHRALPDALVTKDVFLALIEKASHLNLATISEMARLTRGTEWALGDLFRDIEKTKIRTAFSDSSGVSSMVTPQEPELLPQVLRHDKPLTPSLEKEYLDTEMLTGILEPGGPLAQVFPEYEHRPEQIRMMQAVAQALNNCEHLIVEAGTGTGKSAAYLLPSIFFALNNNAHVVISTNTINLQEQLMNKDIPDLLRALREGGKLRDTELRVVQIKGRTNYLCLRRWASLRRTERLSLNEVKFLTRIQIWRPSTRTGDRAELNLTAGEAFIWNKVCAQVENCLGGQCPYQRQDTCFLYRARKGTESAHLIVVNHALLLSNIAANTEVLPQYSHLIIDEAHHLEEEATEQFGFQVAQRDLADYLDRLSKDIEGPGTTSFLSGMKGSFRGSKVSPSTQRHIEQLARDIQNQVKKARARLAEFFDVLGDFLHHYSENQSEYDHRLRLTKSIRVQPAWSGIDIAWENLSLALLDIEEGLSKLYAGLDDLSDTGILDYENMMQELTSLIHSGSELRRHMSSIVSHPEADIIYWSSLSGQSDTITLHAVPLDVGPLLKESLFSSKDTVVLTGATLSTEGNFEFIKGRLGFQDVSELLLGEPFDYIRSTMIYIPQDIPEPGKLEYQEGVEKALIELCRATRGRTLALFTSHAAVRATHAAIRRPLEEEGLLVLGHAVDGSPKQLLNAFKSNANTVLLGTASFWEGIDVMGEALSVLVIARLPFSVPTDPVFAARSEMFEDPFNQYARPQAALKFKQGFGRLIRSRTDRGVIVILDRRIQTKYYGAAFLNSLPPCTVKSSPLRHLPDEVMWWLKEGSKAHSRGAIP